jgi:hypothetical protein
LLSREADCLKKERHLLDFRESTGKAGVGFKKSGTLLNFRKTISERFPAASPSMKSTYWIFGKTMSERFPAASRPSQRFKKVQMAAG